MAVLYCPSKMEKALRGDLLFVYVIDAYLFSYVGEFIRSQERLAEWEEPSSGNVRAVSLT
jgi:hypothetical protein